MKNWWNDKMPHRDRVHVPGLLLVYSVLLAVFFLILFHTTASASESTLRVGVREVRPFIFLDNEQRPQGYSIDLWQAIADQLDIKYNFVPSNGIAYTLQDMKNGKLDLAIGAITITEGRENIFDFSYSHFHTGLGIMTPVSNNYSIAAFISSFFTTDRLIKIGSFMLFLFLSAHVIWLAERRYEHSFHRNYFPGIFEGIYWSIVTASTVGYGDYIPQSKTGRMLAVLIIIISLPLFAVFVANISSDITLHELRTYINGPQDLAGKRIGVVKGSTSEEYLTREHLAVNAGYKSSKELFEQLEQGNVDAIIHDLPTLQYYSSTEGKGKVKVVGKMFNKQDYAFLFPENSKLKESIDRSLLKLIEDGTINSIHNKWFGTSEGR